MSRIGKTIEWTVSGVKLQGRVALVTGVSRQIGIGAAIVRQLHDAGATVVAAGWPEHDVERGYDVGLELPVAAMDVDLCDPAVPAGVIDEVVSRHGRVDIVVAAHARSSRGTLQQLDAGELERSLAVNLASVLLLAQRFAEVHVPLEASPPVGRMLWFTSGQHLGPMADELVYAATKAALHGITPTLSHALAQRQIIANCINPGPVDTGYAEGDAHRRIAAMFPDGTWATPEMTAAFVLHLLSDAGAVLRGQVLDVESGFNRLA